MDKIHDQVETPLHGGEQRGFEVAMDFHPLATLTCDFIPFGLPCWITLFEEHSLITTILYWAILVSMQNCFYRLPFLGLARFVLRVYTLVAFKDQW